MKDNNYFLAFLAFPLLCALAVEKYFSQRKEEVKAMRINANNMFIK